VAAAGAEATGAGATAIGTGAIGTEAAVEATVGLVLLTSPAILVARLDHLLDERKDASRELVCELNGVLFAT
jgi:hypothetical protein